MTRYFLTSGLSAIALLTLPMLTSISAKAETAAPLDKQAIESIVHDYLLANPEILIDMQVKLEAKQNEAAQSQVKRIISENKDALFNSAHDAVLGNPNGDVTIVEFFDYNCGFCKRALPDMEAVIKSDPGVRFVLKEFPILGPDSVRSHIAAQAFKSLMPEKYQELHLALMTSPERSTEDSVIAQAVKLGADEAKLREKIKNPAITAAFQENYQLATALNISGTPSYIIGEQLIPGAVGLNELVEKIALARTKKD